MTGHEFEPSPKGFDFAEMNLIHSGNEAITLELVNRAVLMGYDTVVINRDIGDPYASIENFVWYPLLKFDSCQCHFLKSDQQNETNIKLYWGPESSL
ncbi:unnamed protein product, partial [Mesorhabditis belari]|uniref:Uncharacterized protein n=1 Tax=Mesorhabditis belari TaxID=2138241 RepID=A0AAF3FJD3_9BILA